MLFSQTLFLINIKYMHAGMKHCLAAADVSRRQKSAMRADVGSVLSWHKKNNCRGE